MYTKRLQFKAVDRVNCFQRCLEVLKQRVKTKHTRDSRHQGRKKEVLKKSMKGLVI